MLVAVRERERSSATQGTVRPSTLGDSTGQAGGVVSSRSVGPVIDVRALVGPERAALLELLASLDAEHWRLETPCPGWTVHELALHLLHDDLRRLSAQRDGHVGVRLPASTLDELAGGLDHVNVRWVAEVAPSISPRLTCELLELLAVPTEQHLTSLVLESPGDTVAWAGPGPHPNWLDVAREYTERWVHQQQIRIAVSRPGLEGREFVEPVVDTFARALPASLPRRPDGTEVQLRVSSPFTRTWALRSCDAGWQFTEPSVDPDASVDLSASMFWQRAVRMIDREHVRNHGSVSGDRELGTRLLDLRGAIVPETGH